MKFVHTLSTLFFIFKMILKKKSPRRLKLDKKPRLDHTRYRGYNIDRATRYGV
jgi:hypothetical protein